MCPNRNANLYFMWADCSPQLLWLGVLCMSKCFGLFMYMACNDVIQTNSSTSSSSLLLWLGDATDERSNQSHIFSSGEKDLKKGEECLSCCDWGEGKRYKKTKLIQHLVVIKWSYGISEPPFEENKARSRKVEYYKNLSRKEVFLLSYWSA